MCHPEEAERRLALVFMTILGLCAALLTFVIDVSIENAFGWRVRMVRPGDARRCGAAARARARCGRGRGPRGALRRAEPRDVERPHAHRLLSWGAQVTTRAWRGSAE
jgi:hypothetical protein